MKNFRINVLTNEGSQKIAGRGRKIAGVIAFLLAFLLGGNLFEDLLLKGFADSTVSALADSEDMKVEEEPIWSGISLFAAVGSHLTNGANGIVKEAVPNLPINVMLAPISVGDGAREGLLLLGFRGVTIHETANWSSGSNARMHAQYLQGSGQYYEVSWHYAVDSSSIYQSVPEYERSWHAGDTGVGVGNAQTISIELCVNPEGDFDQTMANGAWLAADILYRHGIFEVKDHLFQHNQFSAYGKNCPMTIRDKGYWGMFSERVQVYLNRMIAEKGVYTRIVSSESASKAQAKTWAAANNATEDFIALADFYWPMCKTAGIDPVIAYAQSAYETNFGRFGGTVSASYCNPAALKVAGEGSDTSVKSYQRFKDWKSGVQAHVDHLALYAGAPRYPKPDSPDPRQMSELYCTAAGVELLSGRWNSSASYHKTILQNMEKIRQTKPLDGVLLEYIYVDGGNNKAGATIDITFENTGAVSWSAANGIGIGYGTKDAKEKKISLPNDIIVKPGEKYTFRFTLSQVEEKNGEFTFYTRLVQNSIHWITDQTALVVKVEDSKIEKVEGVTSCLRGQQQTLLVTVRNSGLAPWTAKNGYRLGVTGSSMTKSRVYLPNNVTVEPGETYTFAVVLKGNDTLLRADKIQFQMLREGVRWFGEAKSAEVRTALPTKAEIQSVVIEQFNQATMRIRYAITVKNTDIVMWERGMFIKLGIVELENLIGKNRVELPVGVRVKPGEEYTFYYDAIVQDISRVKLSVQMVQEGVTWFGNSGICESRKQDSKIEKIEELPSSDLLRFQQKDVLITVRNTGILGWTGAEHYRLGISGISAASSRIYLPKDVLVKPGETYTFKVSLRANDTRMGSDRAEFQMLQEGVAWFGERGATDVKTVSPSQAEIQSIEIDQIDSASSKIRFAIKVKNTGSVIWNREAKIRLGITELQNLSGTNRAVLDAGIQVKPGESHTFYYEGVIQNSMNPRISVCMLQEEVTWFGDGRTKEVACQDSKIEEIQGMGDILRNQKQTIRVIVKNTGVAAWRAADGYRLGIEGEPMTAKRCYLPDGVVVGAGETYAFTVELKANDQHMREDSIAFQMVQENVKWFGERKTADVKTVPPTAAEIQAINVELISGEKVKITVQVKNTGNIIWEQGARVRLGITELQNLSGSNRVDLPKNVQIRPGESYTFSYEVRLSGAGVRRIQMQMLQENVTFFGSQATKEFVA